MCAAVVTAEGPINRSYGMDAEHRQKMVEKYDVEQERIAVKWIEDLTGCTIYDFHTSLKSGVILCKLVNVVKPGSVRVINEKPIAVFEKENIRSYLRACEQLGVQKHELFDIADLVEKKSLAAHR